MLCQPIYLVILLQCYLQTELNPLVASLPGNLNFNSLVSWLTIRASSSVRLTKPMAGNTGLCPRFVFNIAGSVEGLDMLKATTPAPAAAANPTVIGENEASSLRGAAMLS